MTKDLLDENVAVADGLVVSLAYTLRLDDGEEIDSAAADDPLVYLHGAQNIIPGLEQALTGLKVGDARTVSVNAIDAYGDVDTDAFELVPYDAFPADVDLEEGMGLRMVDESTGRQVDAYISELTDDGALQARISHPRHKKSKTYLAQVEGQPTEAALERLRRGIELSDGLARPAMVQRIPEPAGLWPRDPPIRYRAAIPTVWLEITLREGRNRQVRRMTAAIGHPTLRLIRWRIGDWTLDGLRPGQWREVPTVDSPPGRARSHRDGSGPRRTLLVR